MVPQGERSWVCIGLGGVFLGKSWGILSRPGPARLRVALRVFAIHHDRGPSLDSKKGPATRAIHPGAGRRHALNHPKGRVVEAEDREAVRGVIGRPGASRGSVDRAFAHDSGCIRLPAAGPSGGPGGGAEAGADGGVRGRDLLCAF